MLIKIREYDKDLYLHNVIDLAISVEDKEAEKKISDFILKHIERKDEFKPFLMTLIQSIQKVKTEVIKEGIDVKSVLDDACYNFNKIIHEIETEHDNLEIYTRGGYVDTDKFRVLFIIRIDDVNEIMIIEDIFLNKKG